MPTSAGRTTKPIQVIPLGVRWGVVSFRIEVLLAVGSLLPKHRSPQKILYLEFPDRRLGAVTVMV